MAETSAHAEHGNTPAAWTAVVIALVGFTVSGVAITAAQTFWAVAGGVVVLLAGVVGKVMQLAGLGKRA
ncbi:HGxxPAAW family protein [Rhizohabitans arisaemae]|uniref:HGxxPAAW family protein n=1 Tax=Rhizohabitans arisaemae TaxID=2720610 RepID=UPI0024B2551A|nr:HGxxPAAW family protein [Rhizohabitans arisaemae]